MSKKQAELIQKQLNEKKVIEPPKIIEVKRVEYFNDRFYKATLQTDTDVSKIKETFPNIVYEYEDRIDVYLPSVTTILGATENNSFFAKWRGEVGNERADQIMNEALDKGSRIHNAIDLLLQGNIIIYNNPKAPQYTKIEIEGIEFENDCRVFEIIRQDEIIQIARVKRLIDLTNPKIIASELTVYNFDHCYAGTIDSIWEFESDISITLGRNKLEIPAGKYIIDYKTGKNFNETSYSRQISAYCNLFVGELQGGILIHLNANIKTGIEGLKCYVQSLEDLQPYFDSFMRLNQEYQFENKTTKPDLFEFETLIKLNKEN